MSAFVRRYERVWWFTTPAELRRIADDMEKKWLHSLGGEDLTIHRHFDEKSGVELCVIIEQDEIRKEYPRG